MNIPKVIIPPFAGVFSAWGMLMLDVRRDYIRTHLQMLTAEQLPQLSSAFAELTDQARHSLPAITSTPISCGWSAISMPATRARNTR